MPSGRCSGCGRAGSVTKIATHIVDCPRYAELFATAPAKCLSPAAEAHLQRTRNTPELRAQRRDERLQVRFAALEHEVRVQTTRWRTPPDLLAD